MADFSHLSQTNEAQMVDVSLKKNTQRIAVVGNSVSVSPNCSLALNQMMLQEIITTARIAGVFAAKKTSEIIPMCHAITVAGCDINIEFDQAEAKFKIQTSVKTTANTGVEMEAFCASAAAALTIYDMIKAVDPAAIIGPLLLIEKTGGKNGVWNRDSSFS